MAYDISNGKYENQIANDEDETTSITDQIQQFS